MKEIDFRPSWYCIIRKRRRDMVIRACLVGLLALELGLGLLTVSARKAEATQRIAELQSALENQTNVFQDLGELTISLDELKGKREVLSDVAGGAPVHAVLAELSLLMPDSLALREIDYQQHRIIRNVTETTDSAASEAANDLLITGIGLADRDVGVLMSRMASSELFTNVTLVYSQPVIQDQTSVREFRLTCTVPQFE